MDPDNAYDLYRDGGRSCSIDRYILWVFCDTVVNKQGMFASMSRNSLLISNTLSYESNLTDVTCTPKPASKLPSGLHQTRRLSQPRGGPGSSCELAPIVFHPLQIQLCTSGRSTNLPVLKLSASSDTSWLNTRSIQNEPANNHSPTSDYTRLVQSMHIMYTLTSLSARRCIYMVLTFHTRTNTIFMRRWLRSQQSKTGLLGSTMTTD
ncbi:hypothetical protein V1512DRAFT_256530 [Lipomyces arxii]|uniref:uncharacterized protein n=1 Tax=Lipomyces arxii TaxID=56418 RepID=UPI0034CE1B06